MAGFGDAIKYLYEKFILRDVLSFVTPGAIVVLTAVYLLRPDLLTSTIQWPLYIPLFGLFFLVGFAVQCFGEMIGIVHFWPYHRSCWHQRRHIFGSRWYERSNVWWKKAHEEMVAFYEDTECDKERAKKEWARQNHERLVVLKQMCANGLLASVIAGTFVLVVQRSFTQIQGWVAAWAIILLFSLFWGYRIHVLRQDTWREAIVSKSQASKKES